MSGFEVRWPKPNLAYSWSVKNGLFPSINGSSFYQSFSDSNFKKKFLTPQPTAARKRYRRGPQR
jgi:hypothetical protein